MTPRPLSEPVSSRRQFIATAAGLTGFALMVRAPRSLAASGFDDFATRESIAPRIDELAPLGARPGPGPEPHMRRVDLACDVFVAGGGLAGVCAALAAARHGARVVLAQDRSRLGGNASSEIKMHPLGAWHFFGFREAGIIEELCLENAWQNEQAAWEIWDLALYDAVIREPGIRLLLDANVYSVEMAGGRIAATWVRSDKTEHLYRVAAPVHIDCTGDGRLGLEAGAEYRIGRESSAEFGESLADYDAPGTTQGSSILFTARKHARPVPFEPPQWARPISAEDLYQRPTGPGTWSYGYWWIELGGVYDTIRDNERLRFELLAIVLGVWDYIKNSGAYPDSANWALETVGMVPGKRESRRFLGDVLLTQQHLEGGWKKFDDAVAFGGWSMDDHPALGFDAKGVKPYLPTRMPEPYDIPFGALYSRNVDNLLLAGRNISASHVAFTSTRVMKTCAVIGQAVGTAAQLCVASGRMPRELRADKSLLGSLQQRLLRDGVLLMGVRNEDPADLARRASIAASGVIEGSSPENVIRGATFNRARDYSNRWVAPLGESAAWLELSWTEPVVLGEVSLVHDTGLHRELTMTRQESLMKKCVAGPQPETAQDYAIIAVLADGRERKLVSVSLNYQRLRRHRFDPVEVRAIRIEISRTHGSEVASLYEVRAYAPAS